VEALHRWTLILTSREAASRRMAAGAVTPANLFAPAAT